jgi:hypothetical protein
VELEFMHSFNKSLFSQASLSTNSGTAPKRRDNNHISREEDE